MTKKPGATPEEKARLIMGEACKKALTSFKATPNKESAKVELALYSLHMFLLEQGDNWLKSAEFLKKCSCDGIVGNPACEVHGEAIKRTM
jgi:hypothetical protein